MTTISRVSKSGTLDLFAAGLEDGAKWELDGRKIKATAYKKARWRYLSAIPNSLYAFCSNNDVLYIGKTTKTLSKRLAKYCSPDNWRRSDSKCHKGIRELLEHGEDVHILVMPPEQSLKWNGIEINLASGLEDDHVRTVKPNWNGTNGGILTESAEIEDALAARSRRQAPQGQK